MLRRQRVTDVQVEEYISLLLPMEKYVIICKDIWQYYNSTLVKIKLVNYSLANSN